MAYSPANIASITRPDNRNFSVPWVYFGLVFLGLAMTLPQYLETGIRLMSPALLMGILLGWQGWRRLTWTRLWRNYFFMASAFLLSMLMASYYAADIESLWISFTTGIWLLLILPGLAILLRIRRYRYALLAGLVCGTSVYLVVTAIRIASGEPVFDNETILSSDLLGRNRNAINLGAVMIIPVLLTVRTRVDLTTILKWTLLGLTFLWLLSSGGRAGILGGVLTLVLFAVVQNKLSSKLRSLLLLSILAVTLTTVLIETETLTPKAISRIESMVNNPTQAAGNDARAVLLKKAWYLSIENPLTGIGPGNFKGRYHPVINEATTVDEQHVALDSQAHNTYMQVLAENGFIALAFLIGMILVILKSGFGKTSSPDIRLGLCMMAGVLIQIFWHTSLSAALWYPAAFLIGASLEYDDIKKERQSVQHAEL